MHKLMIMRKIQYQKLNVQGGFFLVQANIMQVRAPTLESFV